MPLIDVRCTACDEISEVFRHNTDWPKTPACPKCDGETEQVHLPTGFRNLPPAVVVFKAPDGTYRFPGDPDGRSAKTYEREGFTRIEARGWAEVRRLESQVNQREASLIRRAAERKQAAREESVRHRRSEVYNGLRNGFVVPEVDRDGRRTGRMTTVRMSAFGRDVTAAAMARNDAKPGPRAHEPGFFVEAFSLDRSNRDASRDERGMRRRD